jgi:23S rRNA (cytosine1962-C5)-methyltransferase
VLWKTPKTHPLWHAAHARYQRSSSGGGSWQLYKSIPDSWKIAYNDYVFNIKTMGFKHTGLFPEQAVNWELIKSVVTDAGRPLSVLNLFGYTGATTVAALKAGAHAVHVDASKGMVSWAKEKPRYPGRRMPGTLDVDDCVKFVRRELRRGNRYDIVIMDPPSYGRGPGGEYGNLKTKSSVC